MDKHPKSLSNRATFLIILGVFGFGFLGSFVMVGFPKPRNPRAEVATGIKEKSVSASEQGAKGTILLQEDSAIFAVDVASGNRRQIIKTPEASLGEPDSLTLVSLTGPNRNGKAILVYQLMDLRPVYKGVELDLVTGVSRTIFQHKKPLWQELNIGSIALANDANILYYFLGHKNEQFYDPSSYRRVGEIRRLNLDKLEDSVYFKGAVESQIATSPDGKKVYFCRLAERDVANSLPGVVKYPDGRGKVPVIYSKSSGWFTMPEVASDQIQNLGSGGEWDVSTYGSPGIFVDAEDNSPGWSNPQMIPMVEAVPWPSYLVGVRSRLASGGYIGMAKQATLEEVKYDDRPRRSGKAMDRIVVVDPKCGTISTIVKYVTPFSLWSYGAYVMP